MHPLAVGVGMRSGAMASAIVQAVRVMAGGAVIGCLATVDRRAREPELVAAAAELGVPLAVFTAAELAAVTVPNPSPRAAEAIGTPSVAEAAALLASGSDQLVGAKQVIGGITVAAAVIRR
ncbi:MAG: cobalamin biosynthesis protein [Nocardia sp.]|nr:cobalamin biosynthesis protein [Nocardia sp.]